MDTEIKEADTNSVIWTRIFFVVVFLFIVCTAEIVMGAVILAQVLFNAITKESNQRLLDFGQELSVFIKQILLFLTYNTEEKPFPFNSWPHQKSTTGGNNGIAPEAKKDSNTEDDNPQSPVQPA